MNFSHLLSDIRGVARGGASAPPQRKEDRFFSKGPYKHQKIYPHKFYNFHTMWKFRHEWKHWWPLYWFWSLCSYSEASCQSLSQHAIWLYGCTFSLFDRRSNQPISCSLHVTSLRSRARLFLLLKWGEHARIALKIMEPKDTEREGDDGQPKQKRLKQASLFSMFSSAPVAQTPCRWVSFN